jgi:hypothetical protein
MDVLVKEKIMEKMNKHNTILEKDEWMYIFGKINEKE